MLRKLLDMRRDIRRRCFRRRLPERQRESCNSRVEWHLTVQSRLPFDLLLDRASIQANVKLNGEGYITQSGIEISQLGFQPPESSLSIVWIRKIDPERVFTCVCGTLRTVQFLRGLLRFDEVTARNPAPVDRRVVRGEREIGPLVAALELSRGVAVAR